MNKPTKPNITIPESFAANGVKADFDNNKILNGFDRIQPDVLAGDNLNKFIDDTYKGLNYAMAGTDAINLINEGETLTVVDGKLTSAALIDAGRIAEQLATKTDMLQASGAGMPSNRYINLTLQASGTVYTAPANGYYQIAKNSTASGQYVLIVHQADDGSTGINGVRLWSSANNQSLTTMLPCKKGDKIVVVYTAGGNTDWFRFIYAEGN